MLRTPPTGTWSVQEVEKQPELASDLRRFMNYYLPTTRKLVDAYREIELDSFRTEQNEKTKKEIAYY